MRRIVAGILGCALVASVKANSFPGYLPAIGPGALRFESAAITNAARSVLPALPVEPKLPGASAATTNSPAAADVTASGVTASTSSTPAQPADPNSHVNTASSNPLVPGSTATPPPAAAAPGGAIDTNTGMLVTPQMLVPFFTQSGGNGTATVVVPVGVLPSTPNLVPSSSATYFSPPEPGRN